MWGHDLEPIIGRDQAGQQLSQFDVLADHPLHWLDSIDAQVEPQLERSKAAPERYLPVAVVDDRTALGGSRPQVFGQDAQGPQQRPSIGGPEQVAVEVDPHPLMWIGAVAIGAIQSGVDPPELGHQCGDSAHRRVHMEPHSLSLSDVRDVRRRIECHRARCAVGRAHPERHQARGAVCRDHLGEGLRTHGELLIVRHHPKSARADTGDSQTLFDAGVSL